MTLHWVLHSAVREAENTERIFKTSWFSKAARKAQISDLELCLAMSQVLLGQVESLGGGVFKKRLHKNEHRSILLAKGEGFWIYEYLFAKKDRSNIADDELMDFRKLAKAYAGLTALQVDRLLQQQFWTEICHDRKA